MKRKLLGILSGLGLFCALAYFFQLWFFSERYKPSILLIEIPNLSQHFLESEDIHSTLPNFYSIIKKSYVFNNAFLVATPQGKDGLGKFTESYMQEVGYFAAGQNWSLDQVESNGWDRNNLPSSYLFSLGKMLEVDKANTIISDYLAGLPASSFLLKIRLPYLRPPYLHSESLDDKKELSSAAYKVVQNYIENFETRPDKHAFLWTLYDSGKFKKIKSFNEMLEKNININRNSGNDDWNSPELLYFMTMGNRKKLSLWIESNGFENDLNIVREVYLKSLSLVDEAIGRILSQYEKWDDSTKPILIFYTNFNHDAYIDKDFLNATPFSRMLLDKNTRVPLIIHIPGQKTQEIVAEQVSIGHLANLVSLLMSGDKPSIENLKRTLKSHYQFTATNYYPFTSIRAEDGSKVIYNKKTEKYMYVFLSLFSNCS